MKRFACSVGLWLCLLLPVLGCGKTLDAPVDQDKAREVLQTALESWKQGESYGALGQRQPPIYFNEPGWEAGKKLVNYQAGQMELFGRQGRCSVKLFLQDKGGKAIERDISYLIDTTPRIVIVRENLGM
jgi:hypothetical protein